MCCCCITVAVGIGTSIEDLSCAWGAKYFSCAAAENAVAVVSSVISAAASSSSIGVGDINPLSLSRPALAGTEVMGVIPARSKMTDAPEDAGEELDRPTVPKHAEDEVTLMVAPSLIEVVGRGGRSGLNSVPPVVFLESPVVAGGR